MKRFLLVTLLTVGTVVLSGTAFCVPPGTGVPGFEAQGKIPTGYVIRKSLEARDQQDRIRDNIHMLASGKHKGKWRYGNMFAPFATELDFMVRLAPITFWSCNLAAHWHTFSHFWPVFHSGGYEHGLGYCGSYWKHYPTFPLNVGGTCIDFSLGWFCLKVKMFDMVEYSYPTLKVNASEQLWQSRYLPSLRVVLPFVGMESVDRLANEQGHSFMSQAVFFWSAAAAGMPNRDVLGQNAMNATIKYNKTQNTGIHGDYQQATSGSRTYARMFGEPQTHAWDNKWIPHVMADGFQWHATDVFSGYFKAKWAPLFDSGNSARLALDPGKCVRDNIARGKTGIWPINVNPTWVGRRNGGIRGGDLGGYNLDCVPLVGETISLSHHRRPHRSDGFFQGTVKGLKAWAKAKSANVEESWSFNLFTGWSVDRHLERQTIKLDVDRLHILPDPILAADPPQINNKLIDDLEPHHHNILWGNCEKLGHLVDYNYKAERTNRRYDEDFSSPTASESTVEVFTRFRGCWGKKASRKAHIRISLFGELRGLRVK